MGISVGKYSLVHIDYKFKISLIFSDGFLEWCPLLLTYFLVAQRMDLSAENFQCYIYVECKRGVPAKEIMKHLCEVFADAAPSQATVYRWWKDFHCGTRDSMKHLPHPGGPSLKRTSENISKVFTLVQEHLKMTL